MVEMDKGNKQKVKITPQRAAAGVVRQLSDVKLLSLLNDAIQYREKKLDEAYTIRSKVNAAVAIANQLAQANLKVKGEEEQEQIEEVVE